jgi:hypothetical protein
MLEVGDIRVSLSGAGSLVTSTCGFHELASRQNDFQTKGVKKYCTEVSRDFSRNPMRGNRISCLTRQIRRAGRALLLNIN